MSKLSMHDESLRMNSSGNGSGIVFEKEIERLVELTKRHKIQMRDKNILISVYTNASGFLWSMMKVDSGTDLGYSEFNGDCEMSGSFTSYENALEDALDMVAKCDLKKFTKDCSDKGFHWGNYAGWLSENYRKK